MKAKRSSRRLGDHLLTDREERFCQEYLLDLNATRAYKACASAGSNGAASVEGSRLLRKPKIQQRIQELMEQRAARLQITTDNVLQRLWSMATADARKLVEYRVGSCRYCWGMYSQYQYTEAEFGAAQDKHIREQSEKSRRDASHQPAPCPERGGTGFDPNKPSNPECPECWGRGRGTVILHDTRELSGGEALIFAGLKVSADGTVDIKTHSPFEALQLIGRHLGMWSDKAKPAETENPLHALLREIQESHSTLPIITDDPELGLHLAARAGSSAAREEKGSPRGLAMKPAKGNWRAVK